MRILNIKIISLVLVSALFIQNASWASAPGREKQNIQVPSIFHKITNEKSWQDKEQVRIEMALILAAEQNTPFHVINDKIDRMYEGTGKNRIVDVLPPTDKKIKDQVRQVKFLYGSRKGEVLDVPLVEKKKEEEQERKEKAVRITEYDDEGRIKKEHDEKTGITWEEYEYDKDEEGDEDIYLYNPVNGREIRIEKTTEAMRKGKISKLYDVFHEDPKGAFEEIGTLLVEEGEKEGKRYFCVEKINLDKKGQEEDFKGAGKSVMRWVALRAAREKVELRFSAGYNPVSAQIIRYLYKIPTLILTQDNWKENGGKRRGSESEEEYAKSVLEQEYFFTIFGKEGEREKRTIKVEKGTREIIKSDKWPEGYTARIEKEKLKVYDKKNHEVTLEYFKRFFWEGIPDAGKIIRMQDEEVEIKRLEQEEKKKELDDKMVSIMEYEKAESVVKLYKETAKEIKKETQFDQEKEEKLRKFFYHYIKTADKAASIRGDKDRGLFIKDLRAEDISDMFYLNEIYGFNVFDFIEKGRTKWDKKNGKKEDQYEFELDGEYCTRIKGHNSGGEKIDIGHAVC
ncbi:MAG: hypothetical protein ABH862_06400, partial [Candidatus Omnitrophota bacterium]